MIKRIEKSDVDGKGITPLADTPALTSAQMKAKFDELACTVIIPTFNNNVDALLQENAAEEIGAVPPNGVIPEPPPKLNEPAKLAAVLRGMMTAFTNLLHTFAYSKEETDASIGKKADNSAFNTHKALPILDHPDNSVTDVKIGERSIGSTKGLLQPLFTAIANAIAAIVGGTEWNSVPDTTLKSAKLHMDSKENPHSISANQIGAYTKSEADVKCKAIQDDVTAHKANTGNPHVTTAEQTGAYTKQQVDNKFAAIPKATVSVDGLQTKENVADVNANTTNRHNHNNKAVLDVITNVLINTWNTVTEKLNLSGGTLTGFLTLHAAPTANMHAANKKYVDDIAGGKGYGDMMKIAYDTDNDGIVDNAALLGGLASGEFCRINDARLSDARPANGGNANTLDSLDSSAFCLIGDSRLSNARPASDVYTWAKQSTKPSYSASDIGALPINGTAVAAQKIDGGTY